MNQSNKLGPMRHLIVFFLALLSCSQSAFSAPLPEDMQKSLGTYDARSITESGGVVRVVMNRPRVSISNMRSHLYFKYCFPVFMNGAKGWRGRDFKGIELLESSGSSGFALSLSRADCLTAGNMPDLERDQFITQRTLVCVAGNPCRARRPGERVAADE